MHWLASKVMSIRLAKKLDIFMIFYLDNILIYTNNEGKDPLYTHSMFFEKLKKHSLYANLKKC